MKKKNKDVGKTSELLRKLQEAVLSSHKKEEPADEPDSDELEFQKKIAGMLNRVTQSEPQPKPKKKTSKPKKEPAATASAALDDGPREERSATDPVSGSEPTASIQPPSSVPLENTPKEKLRPQKTKANETFKKETSADAMSVPVSEPVSELAKEPLQAYPEPSESEAAATFTEVVPEDVPEDISEESAEEASFSEPQREDHSHAVPLEQESSSAETESAVDTRLGDFEEEAPSIPLQTDAPSPVTEEAPTADQPVEPIQKIPQRTVVRITPAKAPPKQPKPKDPNAIVITPKSNLKSTVPIVIKPQKHERTAEPIRVEVKPTMSKTPIKVSPPSTAQKDKAQTEQPQKKTAPSDPASKQTKRTPSAVSMPRQVQHHGGRTVKKQHHSAPAPAPRSEVPEDERFDIVLENVVSEIPAAAAGNERVRNEGSFQRNADFSSMLSVDEILKYTEKRTGMTPDDVSMIFELGYENELGHLIGRDALKKLKAEHIRSTRPTDKLRYQTAFGYRNQEYTGTESRDVILANYVRDKKTLIVRLALTALITLLLLPMELSALFGGVWQELRQTVPSLFPLLSFLGLLAAGALSFKFLTAGLRSFFRFSPTPYSAVGILFPLAAAVGAVNLIPTGNENQLISLNLPTVSLLLLTAVCDALRLSSEMRVFHILSAEDEKTVLEPAETHKQKLRHGDKIVKIINDDLDQNLYRPRKSQLVSGFFRRCSDLSSAARPFGFLLLATLTLCFVTGFIATVLGNPFQTVASAVLLTFFFSLPVPSVLLFFYPLCHTNRRLTHRNCALVGEESVAEYGQPKTVIFRDRDLFSLNKYTQTMVREGEDFRRDIRLAGILFRKMKGALDALDPHSQSTANDPPVTFVRLGENGTEAIVDNHYHLLAGNAQFLTRSGVRVPKESTDRHGERKENARLMYVAIDGVLKLTYEIEYEVSPSFEAMISLLSEHGTYSAIRTYDPNLNDDFLQSGRAEGAEYVRVIKPAKYESEDPVEVSDSGAVALGDRFDVTRPLIAASLIQKLRRVGYRIQLAGAAAGAALALMLALRQSELISGVPVLLAMLFQGGLLFAAWLATRLTFRWNTPDNFK